MGHTGLHEELTKLLTEHAAEAVKRYADTTHEIADGAPRDIAVGLAVLDGKTSRFGESLTLRIRLTAGEKTVKRTVTIAIDDGDRIVDQLWQITCDLYLELVRGTVARKEASAS